MERLASAGGDLDSFCAAPPFSFLLTKVNSPLVLHRMPGQPWSNVKNKEGHPALAHPDWPVGEAWFDMRYRDYSSYIDS